MKVILDAKVQRGKESWAYIYYAMALAVGLEATVIALLTPLAFPWNLVVLLGTVVVTVYAFIFSGWFQNKLILLKNKIEGAWR